MKKFTLFIIFLTVFIDMLGVGVLIPIYPLIISSNNNFSILTANHISADSGYIILGWLSASYPLMQFFFTPILGQTSDLMGRKKILLISIIGSIIGYLIFAYAVSLKSIYFMFFARILDGISGGSIAVGMASIADISDSKNRAKNFGIIGVAFGLGFILGPTIGGYLSNSELSSWFQITTPFYFLSILGIVNFLLIYFIFAETLINNSKGSIKILQSISNLYQAYQNKELSNFLIIIFLFIFGFCLFTNFWGVTLVNYFHYSQSQITNIFAYTGIWIMIGQGIIVRKISGNVQAKKILPICLCLEGSCIVTMYFIPINYSQLIYIICTILPVSHAIDVVFCNSFLVSNFTNDNNRGQIIGINTSVQCLATALPAIVGGYIAKSFTQTHILTILSGAIIIVSGIMFKKTWSQH